MSSLSLAGMIFATMLVLMALVTTFMTGPGLTLIERWSTRQAT